MYFHRVIMSLLLATATIGPLSAADAKWLHLSSPHFDMYSAESEGDSKAALQHLEGTRAYFLGATHFKDPFGTQSVRVVAFHADGDFAKYRPAEVGSAKVWSVAAGSAPATIAVSGLKPEVYDLLVREYTQLVLDDSARGLPYWFRAGMASVYSTLKPTDAGMNVGAAPRSSFRNGQIADADLNLLFGINRTALVASRDKAATDFYSVQSNLGSVNGTQAATGSRDPGGVGSNALSTVENQLNQSMDFARTSWALVHMLMFQADYKLKFGEFMRTVATGMPTVEAFTKVYEKPLSRVQSDLVFDAKQTGIMIMTAPFKAEKISPEVKPAAKEEQDRIFADLGKH